MEVRNSFETKEVNQMLNRLDFIRSLIATPALVGIIKNVASSSNLGKANTKDTVTRAELEQLINSIDPVYSKSNKLHILTSKQRADKIKEKHPDIKVIEVDYTEGFE